MRTRSIGENTITNTLWRFFERCGAQGVGLLVTIILARLLDPSVYGVVAIVSVITSVVSVFLEYGVSTALVRKKDADDLDFSSVLYFNAVSAVIVYIVVFIGAPYMAEYYEMEELTAVVRVLCILILISPLKNVQQAYVSRNLMFRKFFFSTLGGTIGAAVIGITMAYLGFGVWALVAQTLFNNIADTAILWVTVKWRPKRMFSMHRLKKLWLYGWKILVSVSITTLYQNLTQFIIGKKYSSADLAFYNRGKQLPYLVSDNVNLAIDNVLLPVMANSQDRIRVVKEMTRKSIKFSTYFTIPLMFGFAVCSEALVRIVLTDKWVPCVPILVIFCIVCAIRPISTANMNVIKALGRSDIYLKLEIVKKIIGFAILFGTVFISVKAIAIGYLVSEVFNAVINAFPNQKLLKYSFVEQLRDVVPAFAMSGVMCVLVLLVGSIGMNLYAKLAVQVLVGVVSYWAMSVLLKNQEYYYLLNIIKSRLKRGEEE